MNKLISDWWSVEQAATGYYEYRAIQESCLDMDKFGHLQSLFAFLVKWDGTYFAQETLQLGLADNPNTTIGIDFIASFDPDSPIVALAAKLVE